MSLNAPVQVPNRHPIHLHQAVKRFMEGLPAKALAKAIVTMETLSILGLSREFKQLRHLQGDLWELRVGAENAKFVRYLVVARNNAFFITHADSKQTNGAPRREIDLALRRANE